MISKLQLINAPLSKEYLKSTRTGTYPPLSIATLAAYLRRNNSGIEVELIDGELLDLDQVISRLEAPIVGISCNIMTYKAALFIAQRAHEKMCKVVLGGPYPTSMSENILRNQSFVDAIVCGDGELALSKYVNGESYESIPNLVYRKNGSIYRNTIVDLELDSLPIPDYCNLPLEKYYGDYAERYREYKPFERSLAIYSRKGCVWRDASDGGCIFCMIPHVGNRSRAPEFVWKEIKHFYDTEGVKHFWEVCDTFTENDRWIKEFQKTRPSNLDVSFQIYARPNHITPRMSKQLKELGVFEVFIGAESGDDRVLELTNKGCKTDHTRKAVEALANEGIQAIVSFVLGLPGETSKTIQKTIDFAREIYAFGNVVETSSSILLPIPGSTSFEMLMNIDRMAVKHGSDLLDLEELKRDWCNNFTFTKYDELEQALDEMLRIFPLNDSFERVGLKSAPMC